jgi:hypothetical protein
MAEVPEEIEFGVAIFNYNADKGPRLAAVRLRCVSPSTDVPGRRAVVALMPAWA